jgi:hypothetical protein
MGYLNGRVKKEGGKMQATIILSLCPECSTIKRQAIEGEIKRELTKNLHVIPWAKELLRVTIEK